MAQFIQSSQLSPIPGSAGQQQVVQRQGPTLGQALSTAVNNTGKMIDTAGDIYAQNRAQPVVEETIEEIDRARHAAQAQFDRGQAFTSEAPEGVDLGNKEWALLQTAVASGKLTQEKARLIASSKLRTRIAQEPLFANKLREAASGVLGFNITSEPARQYFASLPTEKSLRGSNRLTFGQKLMEEAQAKAPALGVSVDSYYKFLVESEDAAARKDLAVARRELNLDDDQKTFTKFNQANSEIKFTALLGTFKQVFQEEGSVDELRAERIMTEAEQSEMQELEQVWQGDQTSTEFQRARQTIEARYDGYREFVDAVGFDTINKLSIERASDTRKMLGDQMFGDVKLIREVGGEAAVEKWFSLMSRSLNETQRAQLMRQYPILSRFKEIEEKTPEEFTQLLGSASRKIWTQEPFTEEEAPVIDVVATEAYDTGDKETQDKVVEKLQKEGMKYKGLSIVGRKSPRETTVNNIAYVKKMKEVELPQLYQQLGNLINDSESLEIDTKARGDVLVVIRQPKTAMARARRSRDLDLHSQAQEIASKINIYKKAIDNGWGSVLNLDIPTFLMETSKKINEAAQNAATLERGQAFQEAQQEFIDFTSAGRINRARQAYDTMVEQNPEAITATFDQLYDEIRRRRLEKIEESN